MTLICILISWQGVMLMLVCCDFCERKLDYVIRLMWYIFHLDIIIKHGYICDAIGWVVIVLACMIVSVRELRLGFNEMFNLD